jgi:hypothetical protein
MQVTFVIVRKQMKKHTTTTIQGNSKRQDVLLHSKQKQHNTLADLFGAVSLLFLVLGCNSIFPITMLGVPLK